MNKAVFVGFFVVLSGLTTFAAGQKIRLPRLKTVGVFKHLVLAQTAPEFVERKSGITLLRKYYIARWGASRFEYGMVQYQCRGAQCEMLGEAVALKFYNDCSGFKKNGHPVCKSLESARIDVTDPYADHERSSTDHREWFTCEDYGMPCNERAETTDVPSRSSSQEAADLPSGI